MTNICETVKTRMGDLFQCNELEKYIQIRTPYLYPDGDIIDVYLKVDGSVITLTDLGETLRWLNMQSYSGKLTENQKQLLNDVCINHGIEFFKGMLTTRTQTLDNLNNDITRLAQSALRVSDLWFTFRSKAVVSVNDEVAEFLKESDIPFERRQKLIGRSGKSWTPDFNTRTSTRSSLVFVLSTGSKGASRSIVNGVVAAWYDLNHLKVGQRYTNFVSLFDDTIDVWVEEDFKLLDELSIVTRWSNPDEFREILKPAA